MYKSLEEICEMTTKEGKPFWKIAIFQKGFPSFVVISHISSKDLYIFLSLQ